MRAMILAAGRGNRMRPLTDHIPKPLLELKGQPLIVYHLLALARAGIQEIVINLGHLGHKIKDVIGTGHVYGVEVQYSEEDPILETGGGIVKALPLLGAEPFIVVSADIFTDYPFENLPKNPTGLVHLVLTDNPPHHPVGDYALVNGRIEETNGPRLNFGGIGVYRSELFADCQIERFPVARLYQKAIREKQITGEYFQGLWHNIGTPEQLAILNQEISNS